MLSAEANPLISIDLRTEACIAVSIRGECGGDFLKKCADEGGAYAILT